MLNENVQSEFAGFSERTSIIDASGDANNNNFSDCSIDADDDKNRSGKWFRYFFKSSKFRNIQIEVN